MNKVIQKIKKWFALQKNNIKVYDVFTPTKPATYTFVERIAINKELINAIRTPGKQVVVYGQSGSGKSTLLINKLNENSQNYITSRCVQTTKFSELLLDCFDQLNSFHLEKYSSVNQIKSSGKLKSNFLPISAEVGGEDSVSDTKNYGRVAQPQLNPRRLAKDLFEQSCFWIIEDFHKVEDDEKKQLADTMKLFVDMEAKVIAIGAAGTAREVIEQNPEMHSRVAEILVPLMDDTELRGIIEKGEKVLNLKIDEDVKKTIIKFSYGLAAVCHQLCLNLCREKGIESPSLETIILNKEDLNVAINSYVSDNSDTLKATFDKAVKQNDEETHGIPEKIIKCMLIKDTDEFSIQEIKEHLRDVFGKDYTTEELRVYLQELESEKRGAIVRYDTNSNKYSFSNPFFTAYSFCLLKKELEELEKNKTIPFQFIKGKKNNAYPKYFESNNNYIKNYCYDYIEIDTKFIEDRLDEILENWDSFQEQFEKMGYTKEQFQTMAAKYLSNLREAEKTTPRLITVPKFRNK